MLGKNAPGGVSSRYSAPGASCLGRGPGDGRRGRGPRGRPRQGLWAALGVPRAALRRRGSHLDILSHGAPWAQSGFSGFIPAAAWREAVGRRWQRGHQLRSRGDLTERT